jgi:membrane protein YqaA with SNARE-associated domain
MTANLTGDARRRRQWCGEAATQSSAPLTSALDVSQPSSTRSVLAYVSLMSTFWQLVHAGFWWGAAAAFVLAFCSALMPWINAEVLTLALPAIASTTPRLLLLVALVTIGQMAGKVILYESARRGMKMPSGRPGAIIERWRSRLAGSPTRSVTVLGLSSSVGFPPFYLMSIVAGMLEMPMGWFLTAGTLGRFVRFGVVAFAPRVLMGTL